MKLIDRFRRVSSSVTRFGFATWGFLLIPVLASHGQTIVQVPGLGGSTMNPTALNSQGQVAGFSALAGSTVQHGFLFSAGNSLDLGTLGGTLSRATALSDAGHVVGDASITNDAGTHAFLRLPAGGALLDLGTLGGGFSTAFAVNRLGEAAGQSALPGDVEMRAFVYRNGTLTSLGTLGGSFSSAIDINASGQVAGDSLIAGDTELHAFLHSNGEMLDLGSLGGFMTMTFDLSDSGFVVGESMTASMETHAFRYATPTLADLGTLGGTMSGAKAVNETGQTVGYASTRNDAQTHAFLYSGGTMTDLGTLGGSSSSAHDINNAGQVVGQSTDASGASRAFLWENGTLKDLNTLLPPNSGWVLLAATKINDAGQVLGYGLLQNNFAFYLFTLPSANRPPLANAGPDQTLSCAGTVTLDGRGSSDPDGDVLTYEWRLDGNVVAQGALPNVSLGFGTHVFTLDVRDPAGASSQDTVSVTVLDSVPPTVVCPTLQPLPAGPECLALLPDLTGRVVATDNCTDPTSLVRTQVPAPGTALPLGTHDVTVTVTDASANPAQCTLRLEVVDATPPTLSGCPEGQTLPVDDTGAAVVPDVVSTLSAMDNCTPASELVRTQSPLPGTRLGEGVHPLTLTVTDAAGNPASCTTTLRVEGACQLVIRSVTPSMTDLRPANHQMETVTLQVVVESACGEATSTITQVESSEPATSQGDKTSPDYEITGPLSVDLRAESSPQGPGRVYAITVVTVDSAGNRDSRCVQVSVERNKKAPELTKRALRKVRSTSSPRRAVLPAKR